MKIVNSADLNRKLKWFYVIIGYGMDPCDPTTIEIDFYSLLGDVTMEMMVVENFFG